MDRNAAIGLILISLVLFIYFQFFVTKPTPGSSSDSLPDTVLTHSQNPTDTGQTAPARIDSSLSHRYIISDSLTTDTKWIDIANTNLRLRFSNKAYLDRIELTSFKTYEGNSLLLASNQNNIFQLKATYQGQQIDLYNIAYSSNITKKGDTTRLTFRASTTDGQIIHSYTMPPSGYEIKYELQVPATWLTSPLVYEWDDQVPLQEKDYEDSQRRTTITCYSPSNGFDDLSATSDDHETYTDPLQWVAIKQKFFISAFIADAIFSEGKTTIAQTENKPIVKQVHIRLAIPPQSFANNRASFRYYFGPNDYTVLRNVAESFSDNLNMGWPPIIWVNRFIIIPIFNFLEKYIANYGIIIILLVIIVKLALSPLSYKSYLGMAKMRLLKPELDAIREKNKDNMTQAQQDQMKLYQQVGVNPFSGCIPLVLQMPILFAMFYFFPVSIQLRQKSFLWAEDLSTYDSILDLPFSIPFYGNHVSLFVLLMTISTLVYTWQNNQISSVQGPMRSLSYVMPIIFMFVLNNFASGLSFYYFISNLITFFQQAVIKRFVDEKSVLAVMEKNRQKAASGKGKKSKFMTRLEEAMKASEEARKKGKR